MEGAELLAQLITQKMVGEFQLGTSNENLDKFAKAVSEAIVEYLDITEASEDASESI